MKKSVLTIVAGLFISGLTMAMVPHGGNGGSDSDNNSATHSVSINIPTIALVDVESGEGEAGVINLSPSVSSLEAGEAVNFGTASNSDLWLNYTSVVDGNSSTRQITVELDNENKLPEGVSLLVSAGGITSGKGKKGSAVSGKVTIEKTAKNLVTGIGSCYTETGVNKGHRLTYELSLDSEDYEDLIADTYDVEITYTITGE